MPESVTEIGDHFASGYIIIYTTKGSYADNYAQEKVYYVSYLSMSGDVDNDGDIDATDAAEILAEAARIGAGGEETIESLI